MNGKGWGLAVGGLAVAAAGAAGAVAVRRRVAAQMAKGNVVWRDDGAIVPTHVLLDERHRDNNRRIIGHFEQMLQTLASLAASAESGIGPPRS